MKVEKNKVGAPTRYTPERVEMILDSLRKGMGKIEAANSASVPHSTFKNWQEKYPAFVASVNEAIAFCELRRKEKAEQAIEKHMNLNWKAAAWLLKNKHRDEYFEKSKETHEGGDKPIFIKVENKDVSSKPTSMLQDFFKSFQK